ncbi:DUF3488 and transglutaminase-like domain-containing protein [Isoptericola sp. BMS4]|uniref:transglutaminase family protein n=1 Tax=Isoptericola sp. BMS4 TaxID=2527875 RepID=UPI00141EE3FF|nr:DUF3488 and transglutaminase-like domain-containing protein [Isoptericola sp. BMS4]
MIPSHAGPTARTVATGVLVAVAVGASMLALTSVVVPGDWTRAGLVGVVLVTATTTTARVLTERRARTGRRATDHGSVLPTLAGAVVAAWYALARYGGPTSDLDPVVTPGHLARAVSRLGEAGEITRSEVAPVTGTLPIALLAVGGTLLVLLLADALAGGLRRPAAAGIPLLALWGPPLVLTGEVPWPVFVVTVTALLLLLTVDGPAGARRRPTGERPPPAVRRAERARAVVTAGTALVVALTAGALGGASSALPGAAGGWYRAFTTTGDTIRLAEDLDILSNLTARSGATVLRYSADPEVEVGPLRSYTASAFDGRRWQRGEERDGQPFEPAEVLWPEDPPAAAATHELDLTVGELRDDKLPLPIDPRTVETTGSWRYDPVRDEVVGSLTDRGDTYTSQVHARDLSADALRDAGTGSTDPAFTEVPDSAHAEEIAATAREVVGDAATPFDQTVALQRWLRDPGRFTYSTSLPRGGTGDPVWDFLQHRTGYCVQYATTMVVMARSLGIPTRLAVGYLPGERTGETEWQITGQDSHAWPEVYFAGTGWVRFEPTPAQQTGAAPEYTVDRSGAAVPAPADDVRATDRPAPETEAPTEQPTSAPPAVAGGTVDEGVPGWVWAVTATLVTALVAAVLVLVARRRRDAADLDPERAWQQVLATIESGGLRLPPATTLRSAPATIATQVGERTGTPLDDSVLDDLGALAAAAEQSRYARTPRTPEPGRLAELTATVTTDLRHRLGRAR